MNSRRQFAVIAILIGLAMPARADDAGLRFRWQFSADQIKDGIVQPQAGMLPARIVGPVKFAATKPHALLLGGDSKKKHCIDVTDDLAKAELPKKDITVEAWVRVDKTIEWGGIAGAFQDNGPYEKGWLLGYSHNQFYFAVASNSRTNLAYLKARTLFQPGLWYHVVGTYDGIEQRVYVDGQLQGVSKEQMGDIAYPPKGWLTLGAYRDDNEHYTLGGGLEQVSIYGRALSADEVALRFRDRKDRFPGIEPHRPVVVDWPTYQRDNQRRGISDARLALPLKLTWVHQARQPPAPAWPEEAKNDYYHKKYDMEDRVIFDRAFHVVGVGARVYFSSSSEDKVVCLDADSGRAVWSYITEGPVRLAPTVSGARVLFGSDDGHVYCVKAADGSLIWKQRVAPGPRRIPGNGRIISAWPVRTDVLVDDGKAHVCSGIFPSQGVRQLTLDIADGKILKTQSLSVTAQGYLERKFGKLMVGTGRNPAGEYVADLKSTGRELGKEVSAFAKDYPHAFIGAADVRIGGGDGKIAVFSLDDGKLLWSAQVEGKVYSLAVVGGRLLASTDRGRIYCFTADAKDAVIVKAPAPMEPSSSREPPLEHYQKAADAIVHEAGIKRGYCLVLHDKGGVLACELAKRTEWQIIALTPEKSQPWAASKFIDAAGLSGRVSVQSQHDLGSYADQSFNLVVNGGLIFGESWRNSRDDVMRLVRPHGGIAFFSLDAKDIVRTGPLKGEGEWTHLYGDPGNTACSNDQLVKGELQLQWFGKPGPRGMIDRHHRTVSPLYKSGRLFVPGEDRITAVDAYNGAILWEKDVPQSRRIAAFRDSSYLALADDALYVAAADRCLALDPQTGGQRRVFTLPQPESTATFEWGYLATMDNALIGSVVKPGSIRREQSYRLSQTETHWDFVPCVGSDYLFAYDRAAGKLQWTYRAAKGTIVNPSIAIGSGRVYFLESDNPATRAAKTGRARLEQLLGQGSTLTALDLATGKVVWQEPGKLFTDLRHNVFTLTSQDRVVVVGSRNSGANKKIDVVVYDIHVFDARSGKLIWSQTQRQADKIGGEHGEQERHPVIVGDKLFCEPKAYDLHTGSPLEWNWPWLNKARRGCGTLSASASGLFFRDDTLRAFDLDQGQTKTLTAETRPGCWINLLPAGGLLLAPEASSGCSCNFSVQTSLALVPVAKKK